MANKRNWFTLFSTQFLGVLNDNLLKNLIVFVSVLWVAKENKEDVIAIATGALVVPFILFSPLAGKISQVYDKLSVVRWAKLLEIPIMLLAVVGFYYENLVLALVSVFFMGTQSAFYSPAKYGLVRDVDGPSGISYGTGMMELLSFVGILLGTLVAGILSDMGSSMIYYIFSFLLGIAIVGWLFSKQINIVESPSESSEDSILPFVFVWKTFKWASSIKGLNYTVLGLGSFWFLASLLQLSIIVLLPDPEVYGLNNTQTSMVMGGIAIAIGIGCWFSGFISRGRVEIGMVPLGGFGMSVCLTIISVFSLSLTSFLILVFMTAFFSGLFKVPLNAWMQERVEGRALGKILAYNNNVLFLFVLVSSVVFSLLSKIGDGDVYLILKFVALVAWLVTFLVLARIPAMMLRFVFFMTANVFFKVKVDGKQHVPVKTGALLIANHVSLLDSFFIVASIPRNVRFVMLKEVYEHPLFNWWFKRLNMIPVPGKKTKENLEEFNKVCQQEINNGHVVCIFPEGQLSRTGHVMGFKKGIEHIAKGINAPIIPMHMQGLAGTSLSYSIVDGTLIKPKMWYRRPLVKINIGVPRMDSPTAFELRTAMQQLQGKAFSWDKKEDNVSYYSDLLKDVLFVRKGISLACTFDDSSEVGRLASDFMQSHSDSRLHFIKNDTAAYSDINVLITSGEQLGNMLPVMPKLDKVFVAQGKIDELSLKIIQDRKIILLEGFIHGSNLISLNTPNVETRDVTGKSVVQEGVRLNSKGRAIPGIAICLHDDDGNVIKNTNEVGVLSYLLPGEQKWVCSNMKFKIDEEGFLYQE